MAGMIILMVILLIRLFNRRQRAAVNVGAMTLLFPMVFMGMNKLYFIPPMFLITNWMYGTIKPVYGKIYFAVMGVLLIRYIYKSVSLKRDFIELISASEEAFLKELINKLTERDRTKISFWYLSKVKIYMTSQKISPFSGGIFSPYIVLPQEIWENWDEEKRKVILSHELLHIRSGHIVLLFLFAMLRIYWWINPAVYLCEKTLRDDLEMACDESCIRHTGISKLEYGQVLLNMIVVLRGFKEEGAVSFLDGNYFEVLRKRIGYLGEQRVTQEAHDTGRRTAGIFFSILLASVILIFVTSYPRYTKLKEISLYDEDLKVVAYDIREITDSVQVKNGEVFIDEDEFQKVLEAQQISGDYVYISYDVIMKLPGAGGGGNVAMVAVDDCQEITYLAAKKPLDKMLEFMLKYLI